MQAAASSPLMAVPSEPAAPHYFELRYLYARSGTQPARANDFLKQAWMPGLKRLGLEPAGVFQPVIAEGSPFTLLVTPFPSFAAVETLMPRLLADPAFASGYEKFHQPDPGFMREETMLLKGFDSMPGIVPPRDGDNHIFELRTYESNNALTLRRKVKMFNEGEIAIFQRLGMQPVFFGESLIGPRQPSLTYMLSYKNMAVRDGAWAAFGSDPAWQKLRATPGYSDAEIVSNISNMILRPAAYSDIR
jgi:NIPSNAP